MIIRRIFKSFFSVLPIWSCPDPQIFTSSFAVSGMEWWWMRFQPHFIYPSDRQQYKLSLGILVLNQEAVWSGKCSTGQGPRRLDCHFIFLYLPPIIYSVHKAIRSLLTMYYSYQLYIYKIVRLGITSIRRVFIIKMVKYTELCNVRRWTSEIKPSYIMKSIHKNFSLGIWCHNILPI